MDDFEERRIRGLITGALILLFSAFGMAACLALQ